MTSADAPARGAITREQRSEICRKAGIARAKAFTPDYQRATRAALPREAAARGGRNAFAAACKRYGIDGALEHLAAYRRAHPTKLERTVMAWLDEHYYSYEREVRIAGIYCDFLISKTRIIIEVDGHMAHTMHPLHGQDRASRDLIHGMALATAGYTLIRLDESDIKNNTYPGKLAGL